MIVFCHLLNDRSGSPTVLRSSIDAVRNSEDCLLFVGSQGAGVLDEVAVETKRYWYRRSAKRAVTLLNFIASQFCLLWALARTRGIPRDATVFVNTLLPVAAMVWGRLTGRSVIVHVHELSISPPLFRRFLTACAKWCADLLIYVSVDHARRMPIAGPASVVVSNPISPAVASQASCGGVPSRSPFRILMLSSNRSYKGVGEFMALAGMLRGRSDVVFELVFNEDKDQVSAFCRQYAGVDNVTVYPRAADVGLFYGRASLVLNLSRVDLWIETFGLTLVEAMSFGVPVIAPPVGGPSEIVEHGVNGFLIDSRDLSGLHGAILRLVDNSEVYEAMSLAALERAKDFSFAAYANSLCAAVRGVQGGGHS